MIRRHAVQLGGALAGPLILLAWISAAVAPTPPIRAANPSQPWTQEASLEAAELAPASQRFTTLEPGDGELVEVPDFQKHVLPLMGQLGCNGRSCHGSFQGAGGFQLSLFGYDFKKDHAALMAKESGRVNLDDPEGSKILLKPTLQMPHKGGQRMEIDSWQYNLLVRWIEAGAPSASEAARFEHLEVTPRELRFNQVGQTAQLKVVAHWSDGTIEDVTCLSRFRTNDESIAEIDEYGLVTAKAPGDTHVVAFYDNGVTAIPVLIPVSDQVGPRYPEVPTPTQIDALVVDKLRKLGIVPSGICDDAEFLRRVSLDLTGTLPIPEEVSSFLADDRPNKRALKIDELLERPTYSAYWAMKLCDFTGNAERHFQGTINPRLTAQHWYEWIERRLRENMPYDKIVEGIVLARGREPGESYADYAARESSYYHPNPADQADFTERDTMPYYWARRNARTPDDKALSFSHAFLGIRLECAQCHKHPFDQWTQADFQQFTQFFAGVRYGKPREYTQMLNDLTKTHPQLKGKNNNQLNRELAGLLRNGETVPLEELIVTPPRRPNTKGQAQPRRQGGRVATPKLLGGDEVDVTSEADLREPLMEWLRSPENPYFARALVNRVWANHFHVGIVNPPDDMNLANPPSNEPLLDYLVGQFIGGGFDLKALHREILNSDTYQRSWEVNPTNRLDERNFSRAVIRRLPAEVVLDAVKQVTANSASLAQAGSWIGDRAIGPMGNSRVQRESYAATVFGENKRDTNCDCARSNEPNLLQAIFLQNDDRELLAVLDRRDGWLAELQGRGGPAPEARQPRKPDTELKNPNKVEERLAKAQTKAAAQEGKGDGTDLQRQLAETRARLVEVQQRLRALSGNAAAATKGQRRQRLQAQIGELQRRIVALQTQARRQRETNQVNDPAKVKAVASGFDLEEVVHEAYLRTLSRLPRPEELAAACDYIASSETPIDGVRDLLWALINTKEFVTNH